MRSGIASTLARSATVSGALVLCSGSLAAAAPTITEFTAGNTAYSQPLGIVAAPAPGQPAGALWFTVNGSPDGFGIATTAGAISKVDEPMGDPREVSVGHEGDLWVTENGGSPRIEWGDTAAEPYVAGGEIKLSPGTDPVDIAPGPDGDMWFTEGAGTGQIVAVSPTSKKILGEYSTGLLAGGEPAQIVEGSDGNMWFTEYGGPGAIGRITPSGLITKFTSGLKASSKPWGLTLGAEGDVWFTEFSPGGQIGRITPTGTITEFGAGLTKGEPGEIVAADNGDMYFTERGGGGAVGQITPAGVITELTAGLTKNNAPWAIATGPDGNVWFTELNEAKIARLTISPGIQSTSAGTPSTTGVALEASVLPNSQASTLAFEYGPVGYESKTSAVSVGNGASANSGSVQLSDLTPATTYRYRAVAENASGTTYGPEGTFTTAAPPASEPPAETPSSETPPAKAPVTSETPTTQPPAGSEPALSSTPLTPSTSLAPVLTSAALTPPATAPPALGHSGMVGVVSGTILLEDPRTGRLRTLDSAANVPTGTLIDATHGVLSLTTALPGGGMQTASVWGGMFEFRQSPRGSGTTDLYLSGPLGPCRTHGRGAHASVARASARRELWSKDSHGRYTTHGADSAATVLGTEWLTVDSCRGTLTRVRKGLVRVRDLHSGRTVLVSAGHSYLARG